MKFYQHDKEITSENRLRPSDGPINTEFGTWARFFFKDEDGKFYEIEAYSYSKNYVFGDAKNEFGQQGDFYDIYDKMCEEYAEKGLGEWNYPEVDGWKAWNDNQTIEQDEEIYADRLYVEKLIEKFKEIGVPLELIDFGVCMDIDTIHTEDDLDAAFSDAWENLEKAVRDYLKPLFDEALENQQGEDEE